MSVIAHAKAVHGVSFDPHAPSRLLTYSEDGVIKVGPCLRDQGSHSH